MNLLNLIQSQLSPQAVGQISNAVGESSDGTKSALGAAFPALLGSLVGKAGASPSGVTDIFNMLKQGQSSGGWSDSLGKILGSAGTGTAQTANNSLVSSLLGSKLGAVTDFISSRCGIHPGSVTSILGMAAPLLMGIIGKHVASEGMGPSGLGQLLSSQTQYLKDAMPAGLANTLGIGSLLSGARDTQPVATPTYTAPVEPVRASTGPARTPASGNKVLKWAWVPVALAVAGWLWSKNHQTATDMGGTGQPYNTEVAAAHSTPLPDFSSLNLAPGGIADRIAKTISSGDWGQRINLTGLSFDNTGAVADSAKDQFREIGSVLASAPNVRVQITGYGNTEETGLSQANSIKNALLATHIAEDRITTRGQTGSGAPSINLMR